MGKAITVATLALFFVIALFFAVGAWRDLAGAELSLVGWLALAGGIVVTLAVGVGLMTLVFISSRRGYDDIDSSRRDYDEIDRK
jgi:protein-S-isoprenylcysteine O-methyltransferase Ste14